MRHKVAGRKLNRTSQHRVALRRNMVQSLIEHETISTTMAKAKEVKSFAEKMITLAKKGTLASRRRAIQMLGDRDIVEYEDNEPVKKGTVIGKLFSEIGPRYLDREGGYTRIIRLSLRRLGDNGQLVLLQLLGENEKVEAKRKESKLDVEPVEVEDQDAIQEQQISENQETETADESVQQADTSGEQEDSEKSDDESSDDASAEQDQNKQQ